MDSTDMHNRAQGGSSKISMGHVPQLDGLRAIAVMVVFVAHMGFERYIPGGFGVTIFFFLSGYLITSLMRVEYANFGRVDLGAFYVRRVLRIVPPLLIAMATTAAFVWFGLLHAEISGSAVLSQLFFLSNYSYMWDGGAEGVPALPLWSLAVEEHFYLGFPLVYALVLGKMNGRQAAFWCLAACVVILGIRIFNVIALDDFSMNYKWSHTRLDSILFGCCLAVWNNPVLDKGAWKPGLGVMAISIALLLFTFVFRDSIFRETIRYSIQGGALFVIFSFCLWSTGWLKALLSCWIAQIIGKYSYSLYLIHIPVILIFEETYPIPFTPLRMVVVFTLCMAYCFVLYKLVEEPLARLRRDLHLKARANVGRAAGSIEQERV